jgi:DNA-binding transcriptional regulator YbjK
MENVKEKILNVSSDLFLKQGYKNTTTRQIIAEAGIQNGSLYHFFKNKEGIFAHLASNLFDEGAQMAEKLAKNNISPALKYAITLTMELYAVEKDDRLAELFYEMYKSWTVFEMLARKGSERNKSLFKIYNPELTDSDYYKKTIAIKGCIYGFLAERFYGGNISFQDKTVTLLEMSLSLFNVPMSEIKNAIQKSYNIIKKNKIMIHGFEI